MKANILSLHIPSIRGVGSKGQIFFFLKVVLSHIKGKLASKNFGLTHIPDVWGWVERSDIEIVQINIFLIELSTKHSRQAFVMI